MNNFRKTKYLLAIFLMLGFCGLLPQMVQAKKTEPEPNPDPVPCSTSYINKMTINELYELGNNAWVETKLLDESITAAEYNTWSLRFCVSDSCASYPFSSANVENPETFPNHFVLDVAKNDIDLKGAGMDAVLLDGDGQCVDYLTTSGYHYQEPSCEFENPTSGGDLSAKFKGIFRYPDGTGAWRQLLESGANGEPTRGESNTGLEAVVDHYRIYHPASELTCQAASVTVRACVDANCLNSSEIETTVSLSSAGTWVDGINSKTFTGESPPLYLRKNTQGYATVGVASATVAAVNPFRCYTNGETSDCTISFYDSGFVFEVDNLDSCQDSTAITIQAVKKTDSDQTCIGDSNFVNTDRIISFSTGYINPVTPRTNLQINEISLPLSGSTDVSVSFGGDAKSILRVNYADAGKLRLNAEYSPVIGDDAGLVMLGVSPDIVAIPAYLRVGVTQADGEPLSSADPDGLYHIPAGEDFHVAVSGECLDNRQTPNFAATTTLEAVAPYLPVDGVKGTFAPDTIAASEYTKDEPGLAEIENATYSEVGTVTLQAKVADYLGTGREVTGAAAIGRFTPAKFALSWYQSPVLTPACNVGDFTYLGQPFGYFAAPIILVTAQNVEGNVTQNFTQPGWWKITDEAALLLGRSYSAAEGILELSGAEVSVAYPVDGAGSGTLTFDQASAMKFVRGAPVEPFYAAIDLQIDVEDADGISAPVLAPAPAALSTSDIPFVREDKVNGINTDEMRWGRLVLQNAYGSELERLAMPLKAEYFKGNSFVFNSGDSCTSLALAKLSLANGLDTVTAENAIPVGSSGASRASLAEPLDGGDAHLSFSAPGDEGYVDVTADLSLLDWLRYDWNRDGNNDGNHDEDPLGRATFGIYKGNPNLIYLRETFR
jgi:MSHA biogenesis protein MshQ